MTPIHRRTAPRVVDGRVRPKNNWAESGDYPDPPPAYPVIERKKPGRGYRHLVRRQDVSRFLALLPDWEELARGLRAVVLDAGNPDRDGYYNHDGVIGLCAWPRSLHRTAGPDYFEDH